jgi:hypothetical protein
MTPAQTAASAMPYSGFVVYNRNARAEGTTHRTAASHPLLIPTQQVRLQRFAHRLLVSMRITLEHRHVLGFT